MVSLLRKHQVPIIRKGQKESAMTLIEIMLTISILGLITVALVQQIKTNIDIRMSLAKKSVITHRMSTAMSRIVFDLEHAFILGKNDIRRPDGQAKSVTIFKMSSSRGDSNELRFTTKSNRPRIRNKPASDSNYVVYKLEEAEDKKGIYNLVRGQTDFIPEDFRDDPPTQILAKAVKTFDVELWRGDRWIKDRWDSSSGEWRYKLPALVKLTLEFYIEPESDGIDEDIDPEELPSEVITTMVYLKNSYELGELRPNTKASVSWDKL